MLNCSPRIIVKLLKKNLTKLRNLVLKIYQKNSSSQIYKKVMKNRQLIFRIQIALLYVYPLKKSLSLLFQNVLQVGLEIILRFVIKIKYIHILTKTHNALYCKVFKYHILSVKKWQMMNFLIKRNINTKKLHVKIYQMLKVEKLNKKHLIYLPIVLIKKITKPFTLLLTRVVMYKKMTIV